MIRRRVWLMVAGVIAGACTVSDDDRCSEGFTYHPETVSCSRDVVVDAAPDTVEPDSKVKPDGEADQKPASDGSAETSPDVGSDDAGADAAAGLGKTCKTDDDCTEPDVDHCPVNPGTGEGYCTTRDCTSGACPAGYSCCANCSIPIPDFCAAESDVKGMIGSMCTCD